MQKMINRAWVLALAAGLAWLGGTGAVWAEAARSTVDLEQIKACMRDNLPRSVQIKQVALIARDRNDSQRTMRARLYASRDEAQLLRTMIQIDAPSDLAGAAYLLRETSRSEDEMYMYVPALQRVRRISGSGSEGSLWGTDFSYADLKQINNTFSGGQVQWLGDETLAGRGVYHLELTPDDAADALAKAPEEVADRIQLWVDQLSCVTLKADFFEKQQLRKRWEVEADTLRRSGPHWYAGSGTMRDLQQGSQTRLDVLDVRTDVDLAQRRFNPKTFYVGN